MMNKNALRDFAKTAQQQINNEAVEDKLRHLLSTRLNSIFPDSPWWIQAHVMGTEAHVHFANTYGNARTGFVDSIVGKTAIEYEKNLKIQHIFDEGYNQVKEYCAALHNAGIVTSEIYGVLSDTVRWYGYTMNVVGNVPRGQLYGADNIELIEREFVDLSVDSDIEYQKFDSFINKFLGRAQSRILNAKTLVLDFGMDSTFYSTHITDFSRVVISAMKGNTEYAELIKQVWQNFVAYLGASDYGSFSTETYINEFYLVTVAKIICANILQRAPILSNDLEAKQILNGRYFAQRNIENLVDYDYFGWLNEAPYIEQLLDCVKAMQSQLIAYDFSLTGDQDLFGELLAQLANREHRLLLGQEFTPHWVAKQIVDYNINILPEGENPQILDMCCGSGVFLIESLKAVRNKYEITPDKYTAEKDALVFTSVLGFDIDPLAVMLAKVNWVLSMKDLFDFHRGTIIVPIYHADSLFVATPITHMMPTDVNESYVLHFGENKIALPAFLLTPEYRKIFDGFMAKTYKVAMTRASQAETELKKDTIIAIINAIESECDTVIYEDKKERLNTACRNLLLQLEQLQREGKNGIWFFILSNSYRPGLTAHQFNCIVSNPPWLAMSKLADNPYKNALLNKALNYGIKPTGAAHPHMELATTFLINAVEKYLKEGGVWSVIMPGSLMSGFNHEPLRIEKYKTAVEMQINALWELPRTTFKNKAIVLFGNKIDTCNPEVLAGRLYSDNGTFSSCEYTLVKQGNRSAWTNHGNNTEVADLINAEPMIFNQGADVFPRTALFHEFTQQPNGKWTISKIERTSQLFYLINDQKKEICNDIEVRDFAGKYIFECLLSKHLSPFHVSQSAKCIIPGEKNQGNWHSISEEDIALMNDSSAYVFREMQDKIGIQLESLLMNAINIRGKLKKQNFTVANWIVLSAAGGSNPCAAYLSLEKVNRDRLIIDQTLYWYIADSEEEAIYLVGMINSRALGDAIMDFQPQGEFGRRHIHTLPYKIMPRFDSANELHGQVVQHTKYLMTEWNEVCMLAGMSELLLPNSGSLSSRRRRQQSRIKQLNSYEKYEEACSAALLS